MVAQVCRCCAERSARKLIAVLIKACVRHTSGIAGSKSAQTLYDGFVPLRVSSSKPFNSHDAPKAKSEAVSPKRSAL
jgi:hypothetical protein